MMQMEQQRQQQEYKQQQAMLQQQQQQQQQQQEEYMRQQYMLQQQQQQQQQALMAQPTGYRSNNPFAPSSSFLSPQNNPGANGTGSLFGSSPQQESSFLPVPSITQQQPEPMPQLQEAPPQQQQQQAPKTFGVAKKDDGQHAGLAALMAKGREDGLDTFGNIGNLRALNFPLIVSKILIFVHIGI
jgi:epsin